MPGKHVHFDLAEESSPIMYAYTPSPAFSTPSLPISEVNVTPPPLGSGSPYHYKPLPELHSAVVLHDMLSYGTNKLSYDLTTPPILNANIQHTGYPLAESLWDQPATNPPVPRMEVECVLLPWKITIVPSHNSRFTYVSFNDVFGAIFHSLRKQVTESEFSQVKSPQLRTQIDNAYKRRYKRLSDYSHYERERDRGLRRVDFLGESIMFAGLSCNANEHYSREYFVNTIETLIGKKIEEFKVEGDEAVKTWAQFKEVVVDYDLWFEKGKEYIGGDAPILADFYLAARLYFLRSVFGRECREWKDISTWNDGRSSSYLDNILKQYPLQ